MTHYMLRVTSSILFGFDLPDLANTIGHMIEQWMGMNHELGMGAFISDPGITQGYSGLLQMAEKLEAQILAMIRHRRESATLASAQLASRNPATASPKVKSIPPSLSHPGQSRRADAPRTSCASQTYG